MKIYSWVYFNACKPVPHQLINSMAAIIAPPQKDEKYHSEVFHFRIVMDSIFLGLLNCYYLQAKCLCFSYGSCNLQRK